MEDRDLPAAGPVLANGLNGGTDFRIATGRGDDLDVRFVRLVRQNRP